MSTKRFGYSGRHRTDGPMRGSAPLRNELGERICIHCRQPFCTPSNLRWGIMWARLYCGAHCRHQHKLRNDPFYMRDQVFARDGGICAACAVDCAPRARLWALIATPRYSEAGIRKRREGDDRDWRVYNTAIKSIPEDSRWEADHIIPVHEGGGECDLGNMRTLCVPCHRAITRAQRKRRAA